LVIIELKWRVDSLIERVAGRAWGVHTLETHADFSRKVVEVHVHEME
jgi:hypothetical protein